MYLQSQLRENQTVSFMHETVSDKNAHVTLPTFMDASIDVQKEVGQENARVELKVNETDRVTIPKVPKRRKKRAPEARGSLKQPSLTNNYFGNVTNALFGQTSTRIPMVEKNS